MVYVWASDSNERLVAGPQYYFMSAKKLYTFITELQEAVDTSLPIKSILIPPTDRPWTLSRDAKLQHSSRTLATLI